MNNFNYSFTFGGGSPVLSESKTGPEIKTERVLNTAVFIARFWQEHRYGPTLREIQSAVGVGSLTTVREDLRSLADDGYVTYNLRQARTLVPTDRLLSEL